MKIPIITREPIIPLIPIDSFEEYKTAEPTKIAAERILPERRMFDLGFAFSWIDLLSSMNFFSSGAIKIVASMDFANLWKEYFNSSI